jgi:hypothetical protein
MGSMVSCDLQSAAHLSFGITTQDRIPPTPPARFGRPVLIVSHAPADP